MTRSQLISILSNVDDLPQPGPRYRTIYEAGYGPKLKPSGRFFIDYASFPGGSMEEVPIDLIRELEADGTLIRTFPQDPQINAWRLKS